MDKNKRVSELQKIYDDLLPKAKSWNRDRLLLAWGFCSAIFTITGLELFKIIAKDYNFKFNEILTKLFFQDFYLIGILIFFFTFGIVTYCIGKIIDQNADDMNKTLNDLKKQINNLKSEK